MPSTPCITCSYDLSTLAEDALCPECATPVRLSTRGDLVDESAHVLNRLVMGATQMVTALTIVVIGQGLFVLVLASLVLGAPLRFGLYRAVLVLAAAATLVSAILQFSAWRKLATSRAGLLGAVCVAFLTMSIVYCLAGMTVFMRFPGATTRSWISLVGATLPFLAPAVAALNGALWLLGLRHLRVLARRIPDPVAQRRARRVRVIVLVVGAFGLLSIVAAFSSRALADAAALVILAATAVVSALAMPLVDRLRRSLLRVRNRQRAQAAAAEDATLPAPPLADTQS